MLQLIYGYTMFPYLYPCIFMLNNAYVHLSVCLCFIQSLCLCLSIFMPIIIYLYSIWHYRYEIKRILRVGMALAEPWFSEQRDESGNVVKNSNGVATYKGYCFDLLAKLASKLNFEYQIVVYDEKRSGDLL